MLNKSKVTNMQTHTHTKTVNNNTFVTVLQQDKRKYNVCCTNTTNNVVQFNNSFATIALAHMYYKLICNC